MAQARLGDSGFIAFVTCTMESAAQATRAREFADIAQRMNVGYRAIDSENDPFKQISLIEQARLEGAPPLAQGALEVERPQHAVLRRAERQVDHRHRYLM